MFLIYQTILINQLSKCGNCCFCYNFFLKSVCMLRGVKVLCGSRIIHFQKDHTSSVLQYTMLWAENLRIVDIKSNALSYLFVNFKINFIFSLYQRIVYITQSNRVGFGETWTANYRSRERNWVFATNLIVLIPISFQPDCFIFQT